ncbi:protein MODIFIED TRANSPORT TO THE VACUOLE 1 [Arachis stenosperma]|uniref:protein MODIFIED TRANSPORT TO THE VACUOLE 1 n=1 Tax=Arachis stenosperma TaxID=217475 RepID=UPI0025AC1A3F|nr:protein MODIFIED TRANSPORT TO THE VACUOLE 1 [Arachis stenosperma]
MESSRRAVESYWRSRLIDSATSDEDKVTPVYKLEEICDLLRTSHVSIVKELSEFVLKRLDHKSPIVKQKALRLIKYCVGKSGVEFRREMQRHSVAVRQLFHYKGQLDPLKGDALNKAVRDTAHEAISAIFSEENKPVAAPTEDINRRIQGFGNTNYEPPSEDKKSFISEVVGIGSASIKQGLSSLTQGHSLMKNDTGSYRSPNLRRSLTIEEERGERYEPVKYRNENQSSFELPKSSGPWSQDSRVTKTETSNGDSGASYSEGKTREDRLLETIVTSGGIRLQPTRDAIQVFLTEAAKLDAVALCHALEPKLQSPMWQVRMKAVCVLEAMLRKKDDDHFSFVFSYFTENSDAVVKCSESPQSSLREKAVRVLGLLGVGHSNSSGINSEKAVKTESTTAVELPDLIDTGDSNDNLEMENTTKNVLDQNIENFTSSRPPLVDDLFGDFSGSVGATNEPKNDDDPFAGVSFHTSEKKEHAADLFSGMEVGGDKPVDHGGRGQTSRSDPQPFDLFASNPEQTNHKEFVGDLIGGLSLEENTSSSNHKPSPPTTTMQSESLFSGLNSQVPDNNLGGMLGSQTVGFNVNPMFPTGQLPYGVQPGMMLNHPYASQPFNYGAMGTLLAQQQLLATMANFQHLNNANMQNASAAQMTGPNGSTPLPDIFQPNFSNQPPTSLMNNSKKEDTKAFDFISDHIASARDSRRVI